ncbi:MAG: alpha/beta hydrolase [Moraxellaceae bacterium]
MPSLIARIVKFGARRSIKHTPASPEALVKHLRLHMNQSPPTLMARGVKAEKFNEKGLRGDRLCVEAPSQVILYLHGGGFVCGKTRTYHNFCSRLARELNAEVWLPDYRLAPEHPFPAAIEDSVASYRLLLQRGWRPEQITIAGDSAGGGLTLGTLLALRDAGTALPKCAVVMSPVSDVRFINPSISSNDATDWMLGTAMLETGRPLYAQSPADALNPYASPALGDFTGLPPLFITVCEQECLRDDAYAVQEAARRAGVEATLLSRPDVLHVWPIFVPVLPEAREDLGRIVNFIRGAGRH